MLDELPQEAMLQPQHLYPTSVSCPATEAMGAAAASLLGIMFLLFPPINLLFCTFFESFNLFIFKKK